MEHKMEQSGQNGFYYLHTGGNLIYKPESVASDPEYFNSPFVRRVWSLDIRNRANAWKIVLEALSLGCDVERAKELSEKWKLDYNDSVEFLKHTKSGEVTEEMRNGMNIFIKEILGIGEYEYWEKVKEDWK